MLLLLACRDREAPKPAEPGSKPTVSHTQGARPELPAPGPTHTGPLAIADAFAAEAADPAWQATAERDIRARVPAASDVECHRTLCRITIVGSEHDIAAAIDQMESEASLRGIAKSVQLTAPEKHDGKLALRAYATFDRPE